MVLAKASPLSETSFVGTKEDRRLYHQMCMALKKICADSNFILYLIL
jgi:hypothetical protein